MIARFPRAQADGYNAVVFAHDVAPEKAAALKEAARQHMVSLSSCWSWAARPTTNYVPRASPRRRCFSSRRAGKPSISRKTTPDVDQCRFREGDRQQIRGLDLIRTTSASRRSPTPTVFHSGTQSLRIESVGKNDSRHARLIQPITLQPFRQYRVSFYVKTENLVPADPEVKILAAGTSICRREHQFPNLPHRRDAGLASVRCRLQQPGSHGRQLLSGFVVRQRRQDVVGRPEDRGDRARQCPAPPRLPRQRARRERDGLRGRARLCSRSSTPVCIRGDLTTTRCPSR